MEDKIPAIVLKSINNFNFDNAVFHAEFLYDLKPSLNSILLLAKTYMLSQKFYQSYHLLKPKLVTYCHSQDFLYYLAISCYHLHYYEEAYHIYFSPTENIIISSPKSRDFELIGNILQKLSKGNKSVEYFKKALSMDSYLMTCVEKLCKYGEYPLTRENEFLISCNKETPLVGILRRIKTSLYSVCKFEGKKALKALDELPKELRWRRMKMGQVLNDMGEFERAEQCLKPLWPGRGKYFRFKGVDIFSTILWHMGKTNELALLANELTKISKLEAEFWVVVGNYFSSINMHNKAILFFNRSVELNSSYTYPKILIAHENISNKNYQRALHSFSSVLNDDPLNFKAFYGLGIIYAKTIMYEKANYAFKKAHSINPNNEILTRQMAITLAHSGKKQKALKILEKCDTKDSMTVLQTALIHYDLGHYSIAAEILEPLKAYAHKEANVNFVLGKIYCRLNKLHLAAKEFLTAMEIFPAMRSKIEDEMTLTSKDFFSKWL